MKLYSRRSVTIMGAGLAATACGGGGGAGGSGTVVTPPVAPTPAATPTSTPTPTGLRIVPVSAVEAFVVAPHAVYGAIAMHMIVGNRDDKRTPEASVGGGFGDWRIYGFRALTGVDADPVTGVVLVEGIGSSQYAIQMGEGDYTFGGIYHGGLTDYRQDIPSMTSARYVDAFAASHSTVVKWPGGQTADVSETITLGLDGVVRTKTMVACKHDLVVAYLDMTTAGPGFAEVIVGGKRYDLPSAGTFDLPAGTAEATLRNPATGHTISTTDDAASQPHFIRKFINRTASMTKLYPEFNPPVGAGLGIVTVERTMVFGRTTST